MKAINAGGRNRNVQLQTKEYRRKGKEGKMQLELTGLKQILTKNEIGGN